MSYLFINFEKLGVRLDKKYIEYDNQITSRLDFQLYVYKDRVNFYQCNRFNKKFDMPFNNSGDIKAIYVIVNDLAYRYAYYTQKKRQEVFANIAFDENGKMIDYLMLPNIKNVRGDMDNDLDKNLVEE